ncbi:Tsp1 domain-containing protein TSP12 (Precursor),related, related [Eimeria acervulina]|uniref:Tsp1 domain-containing protein TSP12 (Precursor),related, related n=1 Tax=Eimeria acervulina TaxID=5801 RepID=U6GSY2_EIMAC|nr:Tsp1 domain-containing protein TSP12 (Precursor),related, related [Eimeria acervulina]CDI83366.1 Tsp1 domain-containing protein TSP12 (Precursor),related, related [Eimeria acervulina]
MRFSPSCCSFAANMQFSLFLICSISIVSPSASLGHFLPATRRQQDLQQHQFSIDPFAFSDQEAAHSQAKEELARSLGLVDSDFESSVDGTRESGSSGEHHGESAEWYAGVLEKLERIARHEDADKGWMNIQLEPAAAALHDEAEASAATPWRAPHAARSRLIFEDEPPGLHSALQLSASEATEGVEQPVHAGSLSDRSAKDWPQEARETEKKPAETAHAGFKEGGVTANLLAKSAGDFQVIEDENALDSDSLVTVLYNFPLQTMESKQIAFVVVALPPKYVAKEGESICDSLDSSVPLLKCSTRKAYMKNRPGSLSTFVTISSADTTKSLPLGRHSFRISVHTPKESLSVEQPANWWFATFRFTGGHAITKHWENRKLISKRGCIWGEWRQETPCSTTCGGGFEIWSRSLYSGESEEACGGAFMKRRCQVQECSLNCQLGEWETLADCTKSCQATEKDAFKIRIRKVLLERRGFGSSCAEMHPWDADLGVGWSERMQAVVSLSPCAEKFQHPCPEMLGCRVDETNTRTIPDAFPWGACPFPCGGFGRITSIVQVANGIPRWIGEQQFPDSFQIPCRADKEPLVSTRPCNTEACEDCSVYIENPIFGRATRAWFFFLPTTEADSAEVTAPRGVKIVQSPAAAAGGQLQQQQQEQQHHQKLKVSPLSPVLPPAAAAKAHPPLPAGAAASPEQLLSNKERLGTCEDIATSFGPVSSCTVIPSRHYANSEAAILRLSAVIEPAAEVERKISEATVGPHTSPGSSSRGGGVSSRRPQWFALPVLLGSREAMEDAGNFYLWLTRSKFPNDPEVFKCHLRTQLLLPRRCKFAYRPKDPKDCMQCLPGAFKTIETYRKFVPSQHGGSCDLPHELQQPGEVLVKTSCVKSCSQLAQHQLAAAAAAESAAEKAAAPTTPAEKAPPPTSKPPSTLQRISRKDLSDFLSKRRKIHEKAATPSAAAAALVAAAEEEILLPVDDTAMPIIDKGKLQLQQQPTEQQQQPEQKTEEVHAKEEPAEAATATATATTTEAPAKPSKETEVAVNVPTAAAEEPAAEKPAAETAPAAAPAAEAKPSPPSAAPKEPTGEGESRTAPTEAAAESAAEPEAGSAESAAEPEAGSAESAAESAAAATESAAQPAAAAGESAAEPAAAAAGPAAAAGESAAEPAASAAAPAAAAGESAAEPAASATEPEAAGEGEGASSSEEKETKAAAGEEKEASAAAAGEGPEETADSSEESEKESATEQQQAESGDKEEEGESPEEEENGSE